MTLPASASPSVPISAPARVPFSVPGVASTADAALADRLAHAIDYKTKPPGSLGMLETLAHQVGMIQRTTSPAIDAPAILVFAGDHGVVAEGISAFPQDVTWQMVENFLAGGAAINVFAAQNGCALQVIDAGVAHDFGTRAGLTDRKIAGGTRNFAVEPAMTAEQCAQALAHGAALVDALPGNVIGFGEMGIGNTTAAAALMHKLTGIPAAACVGAGTGLGPEGVQHKGRVIEAAAARHATATAPLDVLATFGGFEIAMMAGAMLRAAERRMVLLIDGFIVTSALLVAARLQPAILDYCVFSHCSNENGHRQLLETLGGKPLLQLDLRLGEGTGSALALPLLHAAVNFLNRMATFASAQVSGKH
ncbi:nicotinate-nucleotide--dimethylbenzimidazole phosphoribosyltransferase [Pseudoduganella albidiflava]|uniref:Nicotinate-nucleotide--dimethylbenzimidazole phosphoribosyltransferase n=1 Tax=Pseudoduganella albidiflava TaxID=321983 RepID=A0A411X3X2_9BURK|nr:nicotinate-nucleotide--dimethylbenzimidazole phosphoribosyltransferase [Pseudoduganella albidiflava]QBI03701.1 nicotinate-nucleotide--dimethylbenzimidazole phosphoribosyltransferase [Pseudoduganella albidiflava]GGY70354.1 nicotinate-nucleotide--dimethylbenzimidazole phosphoribosyltransferase [Pseudoduganella albidiflava]